MTTKGWLTWGAVPVYLFLAAMTWTFEPREARASDGFSSFRRFEHPQNRKRSRRRTAAAQVPSRSIKRTQAGYSLSYGFKNYNGHILKVNAVLGSEVVAQAIREYGFKQSDFDKLDRWYDRQRKKAVGTANQRFIKGKVQAKNQRELQQKLDFINGHNAKVQRELDQQLNKLSKQYRKGRRDIYAKSGFKYKSANVVEADIPGMVKRNRRRVRPVAKSFAGIAQKKRYGTDELVGAVTAMVQTAVRYEIPDRDEGSRTIAGVMPPPKTLVLGQGDCDTKTALIGSILANWPNVKMVGLAIPGHYLMAYHRIPRRGDIFIEYKGLPYVMIESAGPAWLPPGQVGGLAKDFLRSGKDFRIQPFGG